MVIAIIIAIVVFTSAQRAAEEQARRIAEGMEDPGNEANPNKQLASVFGLGGPAIKAPPAEEQKAKLGEPERFATVREALVAVLDDMDETDAHFVVPDLALARDLGLEQEQIARLLTELGNRLGVPVTPEIHAKATGEEDIELRELLERLLGIYEEPEEEQGAEATDAGAGEHDK